jgi:hypothetical protein
LSTGSFLVKTPVSIWGNADVQKMDDDPCGDEMLKALRKGLGET